MNTKTVFIDGQHGTTGLKIHERLKNRKDITLLEIAIEDKKDPGEKAEVLNSADIVFLCLPDDAAKESVSLITNDKVKILDASCAHRTTPGWIYGLPELNKEQRTEIAKASKVTNPGCHATGFTAVMHPLVSSGLVPPDYPVFCNSISGYSGGGKPMIQEYESGSKSAEELSCRAKNLNLEHKHLAEMKKYGLLNDFPIFTSTVGNYYNGMLIIIPINFGLIRKAYTHGEIREFYADYYKEEAFIKVLSAEEIKEIGAGFISPINCNDTNNLELLIFENKHQTLIVSRFDNLGKGASGAAVQNMNIMIGANEKTGL